jgi:hypothetical protein
MDEGRKRVLGICATIFAARKLARFDRPCPGVEAAIENGIIMAEKILKRLDERYINANHVGFSASGKYAP